jgi:hypothetical protein
VVENGMVYPLGMVGEFEPFVNFLLNFLKNLEMWGKMTIPPPLNGPSGLVNSDPFYKKLPPGGEVNALSECAMYLYRNTFIMASQLLNSVADTLTRKPEYGIVSSMLSITMSTTEMLQLVGVIIGLFIAVITAILKIIELKDKLAERKKAKRLKKLIEDAREEEE